MKLDPSVVCLFPNILFIFVFYDVFLYLVVFFLLFISAIVSGSEVAFFSLNRKKINEIKLKNPKLAEGFIHLLSNKKRLLSTLLIMNNFTNITIILIFSYFIQKINFVNLLIFNFIISGNVIHIIVDLVLTSFVILFFGEIFPKIQAKLNPVPFVIFGFPLIKNVQLICNPFSDFLLYLSDYIEQKLKKTHFLSIDEVSDVLNFASENLNTSEEDYKILKSVVNFGHTFVKQVMTPRVDIFFISDDINFNVLLELVKENEFSRVPIYHEAIDNVIGIIYAKDLLSYLDQEYLNWHFLIHEAYFVPENKKLDNLLIEFQEMKKHMAIVVDEYGGVSGLISLEDIMEEIIGDISDEFDNEKNNYIKLKKSIYLFDGKTLLKDFYRTININEEIFDIYKGEADTLAGFIIEISEEFPKKNQIISFKNFQFQIEKLDKRRLKTIKVTILSHNN